MAEKVKTTKIEKRSKKTGKIIVIDYAKVADRLLEFRSKNPRSKISTKLHELPDGSLIAKSYVWKDKIDFYELLKAGVKAEDALESADANGTAQYIARPKSVNSNSKDDDSSDGKNLEKLETIAVGRALALLGYAVSGEIASSEEMEEFENFKKDKLEELKSDAIEKLSKSKNISELLEAWKSLGKDQQLMKDVQARKDAMKEKLSNEDIKDPTK